LELLSDLGADLCAPDAGGATPAHYAAQVNRVDILDALYQLQERPLKPDPLSIPSRNGSTPAHVAAANGNIEALDFLYRVGVDLNCRDSFVSGKRKSLLFILFIF
jgi:ankyrin repeat protein